MSRRLTVGFIATAARDAGGIREDTVSRWRRHDDQHWVTTWSTALLAPNTIVFGTNAGFTNQTLRQIVQTSIGGDRVRVRLSTFGATALHVGAAHIAGRATDASIVPDTDRTLDVWRPAVRRDSAWRDRGE